MFLTGLPLLSFFFVQQLCDELFDVLDLECEEQHRQEQIQAASELSIGVHIIADGTMLSVKCEEKIDRGWWGPSADGQVEHRSTSNTR